MTLLELKAYFEELAKKHVDLKHDASDDAKKTFFCVNVEERADDYIRTSRMDLILLLLPYDKSLNKMTAENFTFQKNVAYLVLERCDPEDADGIIAAQSRCEQIAGDFLTQLLADRGTKIPSFDLPVTMEPVGPMTDNHYGYICLFTFTDLFEHWVHPDRWLA